MLTSYEPGIQDEALLSRTKTERLPDQRQVPIGKRLVPLKGVTGEIKPHNLRGVLAGIEQLLRHRNERASKGESGPMRWVLVTYRKMSSKPLRLQALLANPATINAAIEGNRVPNLEKLKWYDLGEVPNVPLEELIPLGTCHTNLGQRAETSIRKLYEHKLGVTLLDGKKHPSANGPDLRHEFAMLLSELRDDDQLTYDRIVAQILRELDLTFTGPGDPQRAARRARLQALFARVPASRCRALYARLVRQGSPDALFQSFHTRLGARTKVRLLGTLRARSINLSSLPAAGAAAMRDR